MGPTVGQIGRLECEPHGRPPTLTKGGGGSQTRTIAPWQSTSEAAVHS